jgi:mono/diheme cytochrome c family protein
MKDTVKLVTLLLLLMTAGISWGQQKKNKRNSTGLALYNKYDCVSCHGKQGNKPFDLTKAFEKYDEEKLKQYIKRPKDFGNLKMPLFESIIPESDYSSLIEYIAQLGNLQQKRK